MNTDVRRIYAAQGLRALAYGLGAVLLGVSLDEQGWSGTQVGLLLTSVVAGGAILSVFIGRFGDGIGRRRVYSVLYIGLATTGVAFAFVDQLWLLCIVALMGTMSTDVVESGPFTSLEQAMLPSGLDAEERIRVFGRYNAIAAIAGSLGALAAGGPELLRQYWPELASDQRFFLVFVPASLAGAYFASLLSARVEPGRVTGERMPLTKSRKAVVGLAGLFGLDAFAGGFIVQSFIAYWFSREYDISPDVLALVFFFLGLLQAASFIAASRLAQRFGLLNTMVFTHLPSNVLLMLIPLAPNLAVASLLLLARAAISQMDVPTRQAYVIALVEPDERTAAAAYTNTARYVVRPFGPLLAGSLQGVASGMPFFLGGGIKCVYDIVLWMWFRRVPLPEDERSTAR
jgi:MFS family permease